MVESSNVSELILNQCRYLNQSLSLLASILAKTDELIVRNPDSLSEPVFIRGHSEQPLCRKQQDVCYPATDLQLTLSSCKLTIDLPP